MYLALRPETIQDYKVRGEKKRLNAKEKGLEGRIERILYGLKKKCS